MLDLRANPGSPCFMGYNPRPPLKGVVILRALEPKLFGMPYCVLAKGMTDKKERD